MTRSIGVLGTAKNTGKTTTLSAILAALGRRGSRSGLTSIGYDGEDLDNVTGLPKPRVTANRGDLVATAASCFEAAGARLRLVGETGIRTPLGPVLVGEALEPGRVVLAGPATGAGVREVLRIMSGLGPGLVLVDGALNRLVPLMEADGIVLATGAARSIDPARLAREARAIELIFRITRAEAGLAGLVPSGGAPSVAALRGGSAPVALGFPSILRPEHAAAAVDAAGAGADALFIPGLASVDALRDLIERPGAAWGRRILLRGPAQLLLAGEPERVLALLGRAREAGVSIECVAGPPLLAVTANPFYPAFRGEAGGFYAAAAIDARTLLRSLRAELEAPVSDILLEGPEACMAALDGRPGQWTD